MKEEGITVMTNVVVSLVGAGQVLLHPGAVQEEVLPAAAGPVHPAEVVMPVSPVIPADNSPAVAVARGMAAVPATAVVRIPASRETPAVSSPAVAVGRATVALAAAAVPVGDKQHDPSI